MSKIVTITLGSSPIDRPAHEGWVIINYSAPTGGRTNIGAQVARQGGLMPTWGQVAASLANALGRQEWPREIVGKLSDTNGNVLRLSVPNEMDVIRFSAEFNPSLDQSAPHQLDPDFVTIAEEKF